MESSAVVAHQFEDATQQNDAATLGMWVFLATEAMFFGVMIMAYTVYRYMYPQGFALGGTHMAVEIGTANTAILLTSSLSAAFAVRYAKTGAKGRLITCLLLTAAMGLLFDGLKLYEYHQHYVDGFLPGSAWRGAGASTADSRGMEMLFVLYFVMTGVHAVHVIIGVGLFTVLAGLVARGHFLGERGTPIEISALYWHFVDIVWIFLFPLFYFLGGGGK